MNKERSEFVTSNEQRVRSKKLISNEQGIKFFNESQVILQRVMSN